jgi:hypothetical protein
MNAKGSFYRPRFNQADKTYQDDLIKTYGRDTGLRIQRMTRLVEDTCHIMSDFLRAAPESVATYKGKEGVQTFKFAKGDNELRGTIDFALQWLTSACDQALASIEAKEKYRVEDCRNKESKGSRSKSVSFSVGDKVQLTAFAVDKDLHDLYHDDKGDTSMFPEATYTIQQVTSDAKILLKLFVVVDGTSYVFDCVNAKHVKRVKA